MEESRVGNSIKNTIFGAGGMLISLLVQFVSRSIFILLLGDEYNGVNGLFGYIFSVLNLAELGFAVSIAFALYAPLQDFDKNKICAIMNYLRKVYYIIALVVGIAGAMCIPFLQYLIKEDISTLPFALREIRLYFIIYLLNTVFSYIWSYKRTIITADQKNYLVSNVDYISNILLYIFQIVQLLIWKNYYFYLFLALAKTIVSNLVLTYFANKKYPYLNENKKIKIDKAEQNKISKNVRAMFFHKFGSVVIYSTTTIIISSFVGLIEAGWYSNYLLIVNAVNSFVSIIFNATTASIGNLCVTTDKEYQQEVFDRMSYISAFLAIFSFVCYMVLFNHFMGIWIGEGKTFSLSIVFVISLNSTLTTLRAPVNTFKNAQGLFTKDWYKALVEAIIGMGFGIALSYVWGVLGIVLGYLLAFLVGIPIENIVLYKYGFECPKRLGKQLLRIFFSVIISILLAIGFFVLCELLPATGIVSFICKACICILGVIICFVLLTFKTKEFQYYKNIVFSIVSKVWRRH